MQNICVTHKYCYDGLAAAWVFEEKFGYNRKRLKTSDNVIFTTRDDEWEEKNLLDLVKKRFDIETIYFLDYCPTNSAIDTLISNNMNFVVIDHHQDAYLRMKNLGHEDKMFYDPNHSGCVLAWMFFKGASSAFEDRLPEVFEYIEKQDLWQMKQQDEFIAEWIQYKITDYQTSEISHVLQVWDKSEALTTGSTLWFKKQNEIKFITRKPAIVDFDGKEVLAVNSNTNRSEIGHVLSDKSPSGLGLVYSISPYNNVHVSVRGKGANDFCKAFGGGGHEEASGFSMELEKFMSYLKMAKPYNGGIKK